VENGFYQEDTSVIIDSIDLVSGKLKQKSIVRSHKTFWVEKSQCKQIGALKTEVTDKILRLNKKHSLHGYFNFAHQQKPPFIPGSSHIPYAGRVYDENEMTNLLDSTLDFW